MKTRHGWVKAPDGTFHTDPDGPTARCGGPGICPPCSQEAANDTTFDDVERAVMEDEDHDAVWLGPPYEDGVFENQCPECGMGDLEQRGGKDVCQICGFIRPCCQP